MQEKKPRFARQASTAALFVLLPLATLLIRGFLVSNGLIAGDQADTKPSDTQAAVAGIPMLPPDWHLIGDQFRLVDRGDVAQALNKWWLDDSHIVTWQIGSPPLEFAFFVNGEQQAEWKRVDFEKMLGMPTGGNRKTMPYDVTIRVAWNRVDLESHPKFTARIMTSATDVRTGFKRQVHEIELMEATVTVPPKDAQQDAEGDPRMFRTAAYTFPYRASTPQETQIGEAFQKEIEETGQFRVWRATFNQDSGDRERRVEFVVRPLVQ